MAAPAGYKTFNTGDVLTASDLMTYVMDQVIGVYTSTTNRDAELTSPAEGMFAFTTDSDTLYYYDGSSWTATSLAADITDVNAGTALSGGGSSGSVTLNVDVNAAGSVTGTTSDYVLIEDVDDNSTKKCLISDFVATGDITGVTAGTALSGGGTSGSVTLDVDVNAAGSATAVATDYVLIEDVTDNSTKKALISDITALAGDITGVSAGTAISGGGTSGAVTINVDVNGASTATAETTDYMLIEDVTDNTTKKALISDVVSGGVSTGKAIAMSMVFG